MFAMILCIAFGLGLFGVFQFLKYLYGNDYKDWKPLLFSPNDTFESVYRIGNEGKDIGCENMRQTDIDKSKEDSDA